MVAADPTRGTPTGPASQAGAGPAWLFGPGLDLWIGCGLAYVVTVPLLLGLTRSTGISGWSIVWIGVFATFINGPHYGATLVRVYEQEADRRRYVFFTVYVTAAVIAAFGAGLLHPLIGSALITLYVSWSPWHFSGQNYGLAVMFLGRRGVPVPPRAKRLLHLSFVLAFGLALLAIHVEASSVVYAAGASDLSNEYRVLRAGVPTTWAFGLFGALGLAYVGCLVACGWMLRRVAPWRTLLPVGVLVLTEALWFVVPASLQLAGDAPLHALPFAAIWISTAHSAQYLWVSTYYAGRSGRHGRTAPFLGKSLLAGSAAIVLPGVLFMPALLGTVSWSAGLASLVFAAVNLHHFLLDGAIWKLREGPVARVLLRADAADADAPRPAARSGWVRRIVWAVGAACVLVPVVQTWELSAGLSDATDVARLEQAARRLGLVGRDSPKAWLKLAAAREYAGETDPAIAAYRRTLALQPDNAGALNRLAWNLALHHADDPALVAEAVALAERASSGAQHANPYFLQTLAAAEAAAGRFDAATRTADRGRARAEARGMRALAAELDRQLRLYRAGERLEPRRAP